MKKHIPAILGLAAVLLGSLLYGNLVLAQKGKEPTVVDVTNLPLDEQGNLKVAIQSAFATVSVVENQPFTVTVGEDYKLLCEANVEGWKNVVAHIYWSSEPSIPGLSGMQYRFYYRTPEFPSTIPSTNVFFSYGSGGQLVSIVCTADIHGPILGIWITPSGGIVGTTFTASVSVSLYLTR